MEILLGDHPSPHISKSAFEDIEANTSVVNPEMFKIICQIITCEKDTANLRNCFLSHLIILLENNKDNCRLILQQSVWQDWILLLASLKPQSDYELRLRRKLLDILKILLYHAVKYEWGGWRVFVDTVAILHSKVSYENHRQYLNRMYEQYQEFRSDPEAKFDMGAGDNNSVGNHRSETATPVSNNNEQGASAVQNQNSTNTQEDKLPDLGNTLSINSISKKIKGINEQNQNNNNTGASNNNTRYDTTSNDSFSNAIPGAFQIPEFRWSDVHVILVDELFALIQRDIDGWNELIVKKIRNNANNYRTQKQEETAALRELADIIESPNNAEFINNIIHIVSQISDNVILACGGILPILASSTSVSYEIDVIQSSQGLSLKFAWKVLDRLISILQTIVFKSSLSIEEIEKEKQMPNGMLLRQIMRITVIVCSQKLY